jgi:hypothetical protein
MILYLESAMFPAHQNTFVDFEKKRVVGIATRD